MQLTSRTMFAEIPLRWMLLATLVTAAAAGPANALSPSEAKTVQERYQQERSQCLNGSSNQDRATCLREAGAARGEALRNGLGNSTEPYTGNQRQRCAALPGDQRSDCLARMQGQGSTSGSVAAGGLLRELVTTVPAAAAPSAPAASPPSR
jgi:hypothetical protein